MRNDIINQQTIMNLREHLGHDFSRIIKDFIYAAGQTTLEIRSLIHSDEINNSRITFLLRDLQANSAYIGADYLMKACIDMETFIEIEDHAQRQECLEELQKAYAITRNDLSLFLLN